ncbi:hypothetical protein BDY19DRAFT_991064 [Irpex rosettiformis]|uniref:Uncharacterized protein n=1 Tax=Irpex rosettiformis TaxID=378272 RepID=A0ACB8UDD1_9APHY|nr:hypothetical protein BDY19DRAFT_991064 [Irpex rosettiformis]
MRLLRLLPGFLTVLASGIAVVADGPRSTCVEEWRAKPTQSCSDIASEMGVTVDEIKALNPGITCDAPINQVLICLRCSVHPTCQHTDVATTTTCQPLVEEYELSVDLFVQWNDNVNNDCSDLIVGQSYCVATSACWVGDPNPICDELNHTTHTPSPSSTSA